MNELKAPAVEVQGLTKHYGSVVALKDVDLTIEAGEYFVLLGPSGGGKTTLLRTIGGFHRPTAGKVLLHGQDVSDLPPDKRPTSMVFQSYALFPHMNVLQNVSYGLVLAKKPKDLIRFKAEEMLKLVGLEGYGERKPHELSGGQQQRVQLARSLVLDRDILLLDEPLAALDAQLRKDMCLELKHLQEQVGITFIHVTHNQEEAMTVANRIALIADGELVESGSVRDVYETPRKHFTASFVGENNLFRGRVIEETAGTAVIDTGTGSVVVPTGDETLRSDQSISFSVRSELMSVNTGTGKLRDSSHQHVVGQFTQKVYLGLTTSYRVRLDNGHELSVRSLSGGTDEQQLSAGDVVRVSWPFDAARLHVS